MGLDKVQIADEAINRIPSNNGNGAYSRQRRQSIAQLKERDVTEKVLEGEADERDIRLKQVT